MNTIRHSLASDDIRFDRMIGTFHTAQAQIPEHCTPIPARNPNAGTVRVQCGAPRQLGLSPSFFHRVDDMALIESCVHLLISKGRQLVAKTECPGERDGGGVCRDMDCHVFWHQRTEKGFTAVLEFMRSDERLHMQICAYQAKFRHSV